MLSVVTMAYNHREYTELLLASLAEPECADEAFELIFIDNGSSDGTRELVAGYPLQKNPFFQGKIYHAFPENRGVAAAVNKGVALSTGSWILQADNDVIFGAQSFSILQAWRVKHPRALISPNWPWIQKKLGTDFFSPSSGITLNKMNRLRKIGLKAPLETARATGSCWSCSRSLFEQAGGWDPGFLNVCASDDFIQKISLTGARRLTVPCPVFHAGQITRKAVEKNREQEEKDLLRFKQRWGGHPKDLKKQGRPRIRAASILPWFYQRVTSLAHAFHQPRSWNRREDCTLKSK